MKVKLRRVSLLLIRLFIVFYNHLFLNVHEHGLTLLIDIIALLLGKYNLSLRVFLSR
jgi:hypothetical protein